MQQSNRRQFLESSVSVAIGVSAMPRTVAASRRDANSRIRAAVVGLRGRGRTHIRSLHQLAAENGDLVALCDVDESILYNRVADYEKLSGKKVKIFTDLRKLLDDKSIDVVCYATPNHWHALGTIWACQAGKDVYVEKPGSHNIFEGRKMVEAARKYDRIVQHGTQCRSSPLIREGIEKLKEGVIGDVYMARGIAYKHRGNIGKAKVEPVPPGFDYDLWLGPAPQVPYTHFANRRWHNVWDYGNGEIGNQGVHQLDIMRWGMGLEAHPTKVQSMGGTYVHDDDQQTPNTQVVAFQYQGREVLLSFEVRHWYTNHEAGMGDVYPFVDKRNTVGVIFFGSEGYMVIPDYSSYHTFLGRNRTPGPSASDPSDPMVDLPHFRNFIQAVRSRKHTDLTADVEHAHMSSAVNHLANIAYRTGRTVTFDPGTERFPDDDEANQLISRDYRSPFVVSGKV